MEVEKKMIRVEVPISKRTEDSERDRLLGVQEQENDLPSNEVCLIDIYDIRNVRGANDGRNSIIELYMPTSMTQATSFFCNNPVGEIESKLEQLGVEFK